MRKYIVGLFFLSSLAVAANYSVPIIINGVACTQSGTTFTCGGGPTPPPTPPPPTPPPSPPPSPPGCTIVDATWTNPTINGGRLILPMGSTTIYAIKFTVGNISTPNNNLARIAAAEFGTTPSTRIAALATAPCSFATNPYPGGNTSGNSVTIPFAVGSGSNFGYYPIVPLNSTAYFNVKNEPSPPCGEACQIAVDLTKPGGM